MTLAAPASSSLLQALIPSRQRLPMIATCIVLLLLYLSAGFYYKGFFSLQVAINLLSDNAFLGIAAIGLTLVIISGGIDLSVGAAVGCSSIFIAKMVEQNGWHPATAVAVTLLAGTFMGLAHGALIHFFALPAFLVTLGGLFFCRGLGLLISRESVAISHPLYVSLSSWSITLPGNSSIPVVALLFFCLMLAVAIFAAYAPMGRYIYAVGGNEQSALLMGLPVARTKIAVYAFSGFCSTLAGVAATLSMSSGNALTGGGLELDAIAAVVVGGTLLSGGVGGPIGTFLGVLIFGVIQSAISFDGRLSSWWARIAVGILLLAFILLQKLLQPKENHP